MQNKIDFTLISYKQLISTLQTQSFFFQTFEGFIQNPEEKVLILRHDVDRLPENALVTAKIEEEVGIRSSYYFRTIPQTFKPEIIKEIADLGHEIGYHYENLSAVHSRKYFRKLKVKSEKLEGDIYSEAIRDFERNLEKLRELYPVRTICMHGSPLSKYDNKKLWEKYDYRDYGIIAEPYFDIDYNEVFYLSDTGRSWNNSDANVRDKVGKTEVGGQEKDRGQRSEVGGQKTPQGDGSLSPGLIRMNRMIPAGLDGRKKKEFRDLKIRDTNDLIKKIDNGEMPDKIMLNVHPQRWTDDYVPWVKELVVQNFKNIVKKCLIKFRDRSPQRHRGHREFLFF